MQKQKETIGGKTFNISSTGRLSGSFNDETNAFTINPNLSVTAAYNRDAMYKHDGFYASATVSEDFSNTAQRGCSPKQNNTIIGTLQTGWKRFGLNFKYSGMDNSNVHTNSYSAGVSYVIPSSGTVSAEYRYQDTKNKSSDSNNYGHFASLTYSAPLDGINKLFKKKHSQD